MRWFDNEFIDSYKKVIEMANQLRKDVPSHRMGRTPPHQPDYPDELTTEQLDAIRKHVDPNGEQAKQRELLYSPAW